MTAAPATNTSELLQTLDDKKRALEEVMHVAETIERLQQGLQTVLMMGRSTHRIPKQVLQFYKQLGVTLRDKPAAELEKLLNNLEGAIRNDVGQIMQLAMVDDGALAAQHRAGEDIAPDEEQDVNRLAGDFRRRVQTAVYLRVLLGEQGVATQPMELAVPEEQIQQQIDTLDERGQRAREQIKGQVNEMLKDIDVLLADATLSEALKENMQSVRQQLEQNREHLAAGKSVEDMPFEVEVFLLEDESPPPSEPEKAEPPSAAGSRKKAANAQPAPGFLRCLWTWCMTPPGVRWVDIRSGRYRGK